MSNIEYSKLQQIVKNILVDQNISYEDLGISEDEFNNINDPCFDMALIKKLQGSNTSAKGGTSSNQSAILLTGEQSAIFPCIKRAEYYGEVIGKNMVLKLNLKLMKNNILYMSDKEYKLQNEVVESYLITNEATDDRVEMGCKTLDGQEYVELYETLKPECFLIVLKLRAKFEYIILAVKYNDTAKYFLDLEIEGKNLHYFYKINRVSKNSKKDITYIDSNNILFNLPKIDIEHNRLVYGAPGTGKSNLLEKDKKKYFGDNYERVTFYPDYSYGQFVGMYKPVSDGNDIKYRFVEGPFLSLLSRALKNKNENYLLIIEEINRANAASVFGDMFQLLDRDENGNSEYSISISEDVKKYLKKKELDIDKLYIPDNFYIWATMNSGDQGVMPLDSAFKRRFDDYKLVGINENEKEIQGIKVKINGVSDSLEWNKFRRALNKCLVDIFKIKEDKLIGPFFIKPKILKNAEKFNDIFQEKLLMYLAEDVLNHKKQQFFGTNSLSEIKENYENNCAFKVKFWDDIVKEDTMKEVANDMEFGQTEQNGN